MVTLKRRSLLPGFCYLLFLCTLLQHSTLAQEEDTSNLSESIDEEIPNDNDLDNEMANTSETETENTETQITEPNYEGLTEEEIQEAQFEYGFELGKHTAERLEKEYEEELQRGFEAGKHASEIMEEKWIEANTEKVEFETFDQKEMEYVLKRQNALTPAEFQKFIDEERASQDSLFKTAVSNINQATMRSEEVSQDSFRFLDTL